MPVNPTEAMADGVHEVSPHDGASRAELVPPMVTGSSWMGAVPSVAEAGEGGSSVSGRAARILGTFRSCRSPRLLLSLAYRSRTLHSCHQSWLLHALESALHA